MYSAEGNKLIDFVQDGVRRYSLGEEPIDRSQLRTSAISVLENSLVVAKYDGIGGQFFVHRIEGDEPPRVAVKRLRAGHKLDRQNDRTCNQYFRDLELEHQLAHRYLGDEFVPDTLFMKIHSNMGNFDPQYFQRGVEWIMLQEWATGKETFEYKWEDGSVTPTPALKDRLLRFIDRYKTMQSQTRTTIEAQLMIDERTEEVKACDTNFLQRWSRIESNAYITELTSDNPSSMSTGQIIYLLAHDKFVKDLCGGNPADVERRIFFPSDDYIKVYRKVEAELGQEMAEAFKDVVVLISHFPTGNKDNEFMTFLRTKFRLDS
jgi:hypothetical protein